MILRRTIAAFIVFVLTGLLTAPAFAGALSCTMEFDDDGCCCASEDEQAQAHLDAPDCECPSCACVVSDADAPTPFYPVAAEFEAPIVAIATAATSSLPPLLTPASAALAIPEARGPPGGHSAPLYLLYDTLLI